MALRNIVALRKYNGKSYWIIDMGYSVLWLLLFFVIAGIGTGLILGGWVRGEGTMMTWGTVALVISAAPLLASALGKGS